MEFSSRPWLQHPYTLHSGLVNYHSFSRSWPASRAFRFMWCVFCGSSPQNTHHMNICERRRREECDNSQALGTSRSLLTFDIRECYYQDVDQYIRVCYYYSIIRFLICSSLHCREENRQISVCPGICDKMSIQADCHLSKERETMLWANIR